MEEVPEEIILAKKKNIEESLIRIKYIGDIIQKGKITDTEVILKREEVGNIFFALADVIDFLHFE